MGTVTADLKRLLMTLARLVYLLGLLAWVSYSILYPSWVGKSYNKDPISGSWLPGGTFGLQEDRAPLWSPPSAYSDAIQAQVRWPWQSVSEHEHVELRLPAILFKAALGTIISGLVLRVLHRLIAGDQPDRLVCMAWSLSLVLTIALICLFVLGIFSMGYALTDEVVLTTLGLGLFGGLAFGVISCRSLRFHSVSTAIVGETAMPSPTETASGRSSRLRLLGMGNGLLAFIGGLLVALGITFAVAWIASFFRGPIVGVWELGTPRYAKPQEVIDLIAGLGIAVTGWIGGVLLLRRHVLRGLAIGLILGATLLGIMFACR